MEYPIFAPPLDLASKQPREWSKSEADAYGHWFFSNVENRVNGLTAYFELDRAEQPGTLLTKAQQKLEPLLSNEEFAVELSTGRRLTNRGYAIAADLGLLVAQLLILHGQGKITWEILRKPKTDQSFNLPVLTGFGDLHLDPVAGSIGDAAWIAKGHKKPEAWRKNFDFWVAKVA